MELQLQAVTGQLYIVNGALQETGAVPGLSAQSAPSRAARGRDRDFFFGQLSLSGQPEATAILAQDLLDSISRIFYQSPGSVTAALRKAIIETNSRLLSHNLSGAAQAYEGALTCAVLRDQELFMAQTGEAFALLGHNFGIERLPPQKPNRITPMGRTAGLDIRYFHNWLQAGDLLLLADPRLAHFPTAAFQPILINATVEDGMHELQSLVGMDSTRSMLIEFAEEAPGHVPDQLPSPDRRAPSPPTLAPPVGLPLREHPASSSSIQPKETRSPGLPTVDVDRVETTARIATSRAAMGLSRFTGWLAKLLERLRPPRPVTGEPSGWALPALLAVAIPLVVALIVTGVYFQRGRVIRFGEVKQQMNDYFIQGQQAQSINDPASAAEYYSQVIQLAAEAEQLRPDDDEVDRVRSEALVQLDAIDGVARLQARVLHEFSPGTNLTTIALGDELNGGLYLIDAANNRALYLPTEGTFFEPSSEGPEVILTGEQVVGSHVVGRLVDLMWRPRGLEVTRDGVAILDGRGALVTFYPNFADTRAVPLGLASDWELPRAITTFNERLYVLDSGAKKVWRYFAEGDGFTLGEDQQQIDFSADADLGLAGDVAIYGEDGSVLILYLDGRLRRYASGRLIWNENELAANGLETPLLSPMSLQIVGQGLNSSIFVADPGTERLVQFSLGGTYLAQFKATDETGREFFASLSDFAVVENPLRVFFVSGNKLFVATQ